MKTSILGLFALVAIAASLDRGKELIDQRNYREAESELREVVVAEPENAMAHQYLGTALSHLGRNDEAISTLRRAVELNPESGNALLALASAQIEARKTEEAASNIEAAAGKNPDASMLSYARGALRAVQRDFKGSIAPLEETLAANGGNALAHYYLGLAYSNQKRPDRMIHHFNEFLRLEPEHPNAAKVKSFLKSAR